jgi:hypothetical protein
VDVGTLAPIALLFAAVALVLAAVALSPAPAT